MKGHSLNLFAFASLPVSTSDSKGRKQEVNTSPSYCAWMIAIAGESLVVYQLGQKMEVIGSGAGFSFCPFSGEQLFYLLVFFKKQSLMLI